MLFEGDESGKGICRGSVAISQMLKEQAKVSCTYTVVCSEVQHAQYLQYTHSSTLGHAYLCDWGFMLQTDLHSSMGGEFGVQPSIFT